jgi:hypothetical protein
MATTQDNNAPMTLEPMELEQSPIAVTTTNESAIATPSSRILPPRRQVSNISLPKKKSGVAGACSNLVNSIVGAGIIGIPFALKESGLVAGIILLILVSYFTDKTLRMLVELASFSPRLKDYGVLTFEDLMSVRAKRIWMAYFFREQTLLVVAFQPNHSHTLPRCYFLFFSNRS